MEIDHDQLAVSTPSNSELLRLIEQQHQVLVAQQSELAAQRAKAEQQDAEVAALRQLIVQRASTTRTGARRPRRPWASRLVALVVVLVLTLQPTPSLAVTLNAWSAAAPMPTARDFLAAATGPDGRIYALAGSDSSSYISTVEAYTPSTNTWVPMAPMPTARYGLAAATGSDGRIYAIGGNNGGRLGTVEAYTPSTNSWVTMASMPTARDSLAAVTGPDGRIYAIGGSDGNRFLATVEAYTPRTNSWATMAPMPTARFDLAATPDAAGRIYAIGGANGSGSPFLATVEAYTPSTNSWATMAPMPTTRDSLAAVNGPDGRIYALGGSNFNGYLATVEAYTPSTNTWAPVASMPTARYRLAAATGRDGHIYAIGGQNSSVLGTVEAYTPFGAPVLGDSRNVPAFPAVRGISSVNYGGSFSTGSTAAPLHLEQGGSAPPSGTFQNGDFYVTSAGTLYFYTGTGWRQLAFAGTGPTDARVTHLQVRHAQGILHLSWHLADGKGVAGFEVYAGTHRLNLHTIATHRNRSYHYVGRWTGGGPYSLHVIMRNGSELTVRA